MTVVAGDVILHDFEDGETRNYTFFCEGNDFCPIPVYFYRNGSCYFGRVQTEVLLTRIDILLSDDSTHDDR